MADAASPRMRTILFVVATLLAPMLLFAVALHASPSWAIWPSAAFVVALLVVIGTRRTASLGSFVPFGMVLFGVLTFALVMAPREPWLLWPVLATTLVVVLVGIDDLVERRSKPLLR